MYIQYGSYTTDLQEARPSITRRNSSNGTSDVYTETWRIRGMLIEDDHSTLLTSMASLQAAFAYSGYDLYLLDSDGSTVVQSLTSAGTVSGTKVIQPPSFPNEMPADLSTFCSYEIVVEAEVSATNNAYESWEESLDFVGTGGPRFVLIECRTGSPQAQRVSERTPCRVIQSGSAVGYRARPTPPGPIWPQWEQVAERRIRPMAPKLTGTGANRRYESYGIAWSYTFESPSVLSGFPHPQPG